MALAGSTRSWWRVLAALVVAAFASPTLAQPSISEFTQLTLERIQKIARDTEAGLTETAISGVDTIEHLDRIGKPNRTIYHYYLEVTRAMRYTAGNASRRISTVETQAIATLTSMGAPRAVLQQVQDAATEGRFDVTSAHQDAAEKIKRAAIRAMS